MSNIETRPFLKWAGGKTQLLSQLGKYFPERLLEGKIKKYVEPFVGAGAVFFFLNFKFKFDSVILNDINEELILTYKVIQSSIDELIKVLSVLESSYLKAGDLSEKEKIYYEQRDLFNQEKTTLDYKNYSENWLYHAARMIFLNKTCFNGLYRQNRKGGFNVPFGKRDNPTICDKVNLRAVNSALKNVTLVCGDFKELTNYIDDETFVYMDPPYRPLSSTSSFTDYSKVPFNDDSQKELANWYRVLDSMGAALMLSNSDPKNADGNDNFFENLYEGFNINRIKASRAINSKGSGRGKINELLIINEEPIPSLISEDVAVTMKDE